MADDPTPPTPPAPTPPADPPKSFTQEQVNAFLAEQKRKMQAEVPDLADLRAKAKQFDELQAANKTEVEKLTERAAQAEAAAKAATDRAAAALRRSAVVAAAQRAGAVDPDVVFALIPTDAVTVSDDGSVTGVDDAVKAVLDAKQYLVGKPPTPTPGGADGGPRGTPTGTISREDLSKMTPDAIAAAFKAGELKHLTSSPT